MNKRLLASLGGGALVAAGVVGAVLLGGPNNAQADFDLTGLNDQVQNHEERLDNHEARITNVENNQTEIQRATGVAPATTQVPVPTVTPTPPPPPSSPPPTPKSTVKSEQISTDYPHRTCVWRYSYSDGTSEDVTLGEQMCNFPLPTGSSSNQIDL